MTLLPLAGELWPSAQCPVCRPASDFLDPESGADMTSVTLRLGHKRPWSSHLAPRSTELPCWRNPATHCDHTSRPSPAFCQPCHLGSGSSGPRCWSHPSFSLPAEALAIKERTIPSRTLPKFLSLCEDLFSQSNSTSVKSHFAVRAVKLKLTLPPPRQTYLEANLENQ